MKNLEAISPSQSPGALRVALAGNPNSGKTSLFNALTGANQHVGNYPGVTVEKRSGGYSFQDSRFEIHDLPGTYSLTSFSPEERIAQEELLEGHYDVVVVVADSTALRRSLVLLCQVMQTGTNPVLCLNMADEAQRAGQKIDLEQMQALLGFPVVETIGHRGTGSAELKQAIQAAYNNPVSAHRLVLGERMDRALAAISAKLVGTEWDANDWVATKLLLNETSFADGLPLVREDIAAGIAEAKRQRIQIESETGQDIALFVTECHFSFVNGLLREVVTSTARADARAITDAIDKVLVHRFFGLPIFAAVMYGIFWTTFSVGEIPMAWIEAAFEALGNWVTGLWPAGVASPLQSLLVDGVIGGVGGVVIFLPNIVLLFMGLALLEDTGYMARVAFLMDRVMHRFGLHGKSFVPMMTGFGCTIPGIMATRTLENERDRLTTILILPLMSCGARLPIWMLLIPALFPPVWRSPMLFFVYAFGVFLALVLALALRKSVLRGEEAPFVMELPPYRLPTIKATVHKMTERSWIYLRKAGTIILGISMLMWFVTSYPKKSVYDVDIEVASGVSQLSESEINGVRASEDLRYSIAGRVGGFVEPVIRPLGFDWKIGTAMIGAFAAKEVFVAQMGIVYSLGETDEESKGLREALAEEYSPLTGLSLILFLLISSPCMATIAITRRETGSWRWALLQFGGLTAVAYLISLVVYQVGRWFL